MKRLATRALCGLIIAAVLGACTGAESVAAPPGTSAAASASVAKPSVVAVVTHYYRAIVGREYRQAFGYLAPGATGPDGRKLTLRSFLRLANMLDGLGGPVTRFSVGVYRSEVVMTITRVRYGPYHAHLRVVRISRGWAIASVDRI